MKINWLTFVISPGGDNYVRASRATGRSAVRDPTTPYRRASVGRLERSEVHNPPICALRGSDGPFKPSKRSPYVGETPVRCTYSR